MPQEPSKPRQEQQQQSSNQEEVERVPTQSSQIKSPCDQQILHLDQQQSRLGPQPGQPYPQQCQSDPQQYQPSQQQQIGQQQASPGQIQQNLYAYPAAGVAHPGADRVVFLHAAPQSSYMRRGETQGERNFRQFHDCENFDEKKVRRVFVRKVYLILTLQLIFTMAVMAVFIFQEDVKNFVRTTPLVYYIALCVFFAVFIALACSKSLRRRYPTNFIMLIIFTLDMAYLMGTISSFHNTKIVIMAVGICAVVCFAVTILSFNTKLDFTGCGGILYILIVVLIIFGLIAIFFRSQLMTMIYAGLGAMIFMMYLAYDTQLIMGGKQVEISPEEYIMAALMLYVDIMYIYMFLLTLIGQSQ